MDAQESHDPNDLTTTVVTQLFYDEAEARGGKPPTATDVNRVVDDYFHKRELPQKLEGRTPGFVANVAKELRSQHYPGFNFKTDNAEVATLQNVNRLVAKAVAQHIQSRRAAK